MKKRLTKKLEKKYYKQIHQRITIANLFAQTILQAQRIINQWIIPKSNGITPDYSKMPFVIGDIIQTKENHEYFIDLSNRLHVANLEDGHKRFQIELDKATVRQCLETAFTKNELNHWELSK